jgi:hypothetical protein
MRQFRHLRGKKSQIIRLFERMAKLKPRLFVHWEQGCRVRLLDGSGMSREVHVPFCEGLAVKLRGSTHLTYLAASIRGTFYRLYTGGPVRGRPGARDGRLGPTAMGEFATETQHPVDARDPRRYSTRPSSNPNFPPNPSTVSPAPVAGSMASHNEHHRHGALKFVTP